MKSFDKLMILLLYCVFLIQSLGRQTLPDTNVGVSAEPQQTDGATLDAGTFVPYCSWNSN